MSKRSYVSAALSNEVKNQSSREVYPTDYRQPQFLEVESHITAYGHSEPINKTCSNNFRISFKIVCVLVVHLLDDLAHSPMVTHKLSLTYGL